MTNARPKSCADCGGFDIEWMYKCHRHGVEFCRGCACPTCAEQDDFNEPPDEIEDWGDQ